MSEPKMRMDILDNNVLTLWDPDFLGQGNSGAVVILVNNNHRQCG